MAGAQIGRHHGTAYLRITFRVLKVPGAFALGAEIGLPAQDQVHPAALPGAQGLEGEAPQLPGLLGGHGGHGLQLLHAEEAEGLHVQVDQLAFLALALGLVEQELEGIQGLALVGQQPLGVGARQDQAVREELLVAGGLELGGDGQPQLLAPAGDEFGEGFQVRGGLAHGRSDQMTTGWGL